MRKYVDFVEGTDSRAVSGASVYVTTYPDNLAATLYADDAGTPLANPLTTDNTGEYSFYVANGHYTLTISGSGLVTKTITDVVIFDPSDVLTSETNAAASATAAAGSATASAGSASSAASSATSATGSATTAVNSATAAASSATTAQNAASSAIISAGNAVDEPTGRAAVADGVAFRVQGSGDIAVYEYRRVDVNSSTLIATYPSKSRVDTIYGVGIAGYSGSASVLPLVADKNGKVLFGYDSANDVLTGIPYTAAGTSGSYALNHLLFYGQSLSKGYAGGAPITTTQPYSNLTFTTGPVGTSTASKPLVETTVESSCSGAANMATSIAVVAGKTPTDHVIFSSAAGLEGMRIDQLSKGTTQYNTVLLVHMQNAKTINASYAVRAIAYIQGEHDVINGTSYASYYAQMLQLQADMQTDAQAISGQGSFVPVLLYQTPYGSATTKNIVTAQLNIAQASSKFAIATPIYHLPSVDGTHLTNIGYKWMGAYFGRAYKQWAIDGVKPTWLNPLSATLRANVLRIRFSVPTLPLVLDTVALAATTDKGFRVVDTLGTVAISSIAIDGSDVVLTLGATPVGATVARYGLDYLGTGLIWTNGASGNLRDSTADTITISGVVRPLYHVCPHFELNVTTLGE